MPLLKKRKTYAEKCPVCGGDIHPHDDIHPLSEETVYFDELPPDVPVLAEVTPGHWVKVVERKPAKA
ncbi:hypothetical protein ANME2D_02509 [Candidatus Methanoperedens nitroreducens]|uniref:Uncharacterized protein n=1 Tax=Candidatus Methanoperedens nitratireducens TaxID=1392998 RepID=A0A062UWB7_9EURY|nr:hypothetical protein [Candidatus Methanoperedens nitroreducens]KCZ71306.1 hypothetical protein ANME2D_02509 [Candidatus Methanoperedens nitroreducens]MDJ1423757.1 hypothetical protein [Candidatus Methanoperedens sp.]